jgi:hypothetical protein
MQRVKRSSAIAVLPAAPAGGTPGFFASPNPAGGVPATVPGYEWYNGIQEELAAVIELAGIVLSGATNNQLVTAISKMIEARVGDYALDTGAANAYVIALNPAITVYTNGIDVRFRVVNANTGASTLNAGGGAVPLRNDINGALVAGDLPVGSVVSAVYDSTAAAFLITSLVTSQAMSQAAADGRYAALAGLSTQIFRAANAVGANDVVVYGQAFGIGQANTDVKASRVLGQTYPNSTAKAREVSVISLLAASAVLSATVNGIQKCYMANNATSATGLTVTFTVMPGESYVVSGGTLSSWVETI